MEGWRDTGMERCWRPPSCLARHSPHLPVQPETSVPAEHRVGLRDTWPPPQGTNRVPMSTSQNSWWVLQQLICTASLPRQEHDAHWDNTTANGAVGFHSPERDGEKGKVRERVGGGHRLHGLHGVDQDECRHGELDAGVGKEMVQAYLGDVFPVVPEFLEGGHGRKPGGVPTSNGLQTWPHTQPYRWWLQWGQEEARELEKAERHHGGEGVNVESVPQTGEAPVWSQREAGGKGQWTWDTCQHSQSRTAPVSPGAFPAIPAASLPHPNVLPEAADGETEARGNSGTQSPLWPSPTPPRCPPSPHPPLPSAPHPHVPQGPACFPPPQDGRGGGAVWVTLCDQGGLSPTAKLHVRLTPLISSNEPSFLCSSLSFPVTSANVGAARGVPLVFLGWGD